MSFLPFPNSLGVFLVPEIILIAWFLEPDPLSVSPPGLLALPFGAEALTFPVAIIRKKIFLTVQALTQALLSLHRFKKSNQPVSEKSEQGGRKIPQEEKSEQRRRKKTFQ